MDQALQRLNTINFNQSIREGKMQESIGDLETSIDNNHRKTITRFGKTAEAMNRIADAQGLNLTQMTDRGESNKKGTNNKRSREITEEEETEGTTEDPMLGVQRNQNEEITFAPDDTGEASPKSEDLNGSSTREGSELA
jgi:hypothetical protein